MAATPENIRKQMTRATEALEAMPVTHQTRAVGANRLMAAISAPGLEPWEASSGVAQFGAAGSWAIRQMGGYDGSQWLLARLRKVYQDTVTTIGKSAPITVDPKTGKPDAPRRVQTRKAFEEQQERQHGGSTQAGAFFSSLVQSGKETMQEVNKGTRDVLDFTPTLIKIAMGVGAAYILFELYKGFQNVKSTMPSIRIVTENKDKDDEDDDADTDN